MVVYNIKFPCGLEVSLDQNTAKIDSKETAILDYVREVGCPLHGKNHRKCNRRK